MPSNKLPNGTNLGSLFHGTPLPFDKFGDPETMHRDRGAGYDHQGRAVYLTTDPNGYGRFFARESCSKLALKQLMSGQEAESDRIAVSDGVILAVQISPDACILDMNDAPAAIKSLFDNSVGNLAIGSQLRQAVLDAGYDGIMFNEKNYPEGWETAKAKTVAVYHHEKAIITGCRDANDYKLERNWTERGESGLAKEGSNMPRDEWIASAKQMYLEAGDTDANAHELAAWLCEQEDWRSDNIQDPIEAAKNDIAGRHQPKPS